MSRSLKDPDEIKKIEANSWKGPENFDSYKNSISGTYEREFKDYLLEKSVDGLSLKGKNVINVGGGHGEEAEILIKKGAGNVILVDIAPKQIESAKNRKNEHKLHNLFVELGDAENLDYDNKKFDLGFIYMALHHFPSHKKSITEICRVSKQVIFIDIMNSELTKLLGFFGLFNEEMPGIKPNRLEEDTVSQIMEENGMKMEIEYFFYPPYYGNSLFLLKFIKILSYVVNQVIRFKIVAITFGNVAIIKGKV